MLLLLVVVVQVLLLWPMVLKLQDDVTTFCCKKYSDWMLQVTRIS